jgi:hypothetical protein
MYGAEQGNSRMYFDKEAELDSVKMTADNGRLIQVLELITTEANAADFGNRSTARISKN